MSARRNTTVEFPCVLKTIISHTHRDDPSFSRNDKQIRSTLRAKLNDDHVKNTSWIANNQRDYDRIRRAFDAKYDARMSHATKRPARKSRKSSSAPVDNVPENA